MFKVSLLPESYRRFLDGKKKKDLIMRVAVLILMCMLIVYAGFAARMFILQGQLKKIEQKNSLVSAQVNELQQYKGIYDSLALAKTRVDGIKPGIPSSIKFYTMIKAGRPDYIKINALALSEWQSNKICVIDGELPAANTLGQAVEQLEAYKESFTADEIYGGLVKEVKVANDGMPTYDAESESSNYVFRVFVSLGGPINVDDSGTLITTTETTTETTTANAQETTNEAPSDNASQSTTIAESTTLNEAQTTVADASNNETTEAVSETAAQ